MTWRGDTEPAAGDSTAQRVYNRLALQRMAIEPVFDIAVWAVALTAADALRYGSAHDLLTWRLTVVIAFAAVGQVLLGFVGGLYRIKWRVGSFENLASLTRTIVLVTAFVALINVTLYNHAIPASATIGGGAFALFLAGAGRSLWRLHWEWKLRPADPAQRAIIFGAGKAGAQLVTALMTDPDSPYLPVALLDDDPAKRHLALRHLRVRGSRDAMESVAKSHRADALIIAIPSADSTLIRELSERASTAGLAAKVLPPVTQLLEGSIGVGDVRPVTPEDLLGRHVVDTEVESIAGHITGKRVLVTGAGGSIGSELCRQLARFEPSRLVMLDRDESGLHEVQLSIEGRALLDDRALVVCDIRDSGALRAAFEEHRPEVVFHAAALKHLPLLEMWPAEAVKTNVFGTRNVLQASSAVGVDRFVNVSTDKAADPCSVLGYTKRLAELLTATVGATEPGVYLSVRFGNVLGSRGSVLRAFRAQIAEGGPVTVTSPAVTRYFMTLQEAVQLVVQAAAVGDPGEVLVLDMGSPVRIAEVAERLIHDSGKSIEIVYTGLRPGEKLHETLFAENEVGRRRVHPLISHVEVPLVSLAELDRMDLGQGCEGLKRDLQQRCTVTQGAASVASASLSQRFAR